MMAAPSFSSLENDAFLQTFNKTGVKEGIEERHKYIDEGVNCLNNIDKQYTHIFENSAIENTGPQIKRRFEVETLPSTKANSIHTSEKEEMWWIGIVTEIGCDSFSASLEDLQGRINFVEFETRILDDHSKNELKIGSRFTYTISSLETYTGGKKYTPSLSFVTQAKWFSEYESRVQDVIDCTLPDDLFNL